MSKKVPKTICIFGARFMLEQIQCLESQIDGVQKGKDVEFVHKMRVASRRLRNCLGLFRECLPGKKSKVWLHDIFNITHALGNARDLDIQIAELSRFYNDDLETKYRPGYSRLLLRLKQSRTKAQKKINKTIYQLQKDETLSKLTTHLNKLTENFDGESISSPALKLKAFDSIRTELNEFLSYQPFIREPENMDKLHAMRISGKHLRYTMEVFAPVYSGELDPFILLMKNIQDILGEIHDDDVWVNWLPKFIEKEKKRVEDYFGNTGPIVRLLPGLNHYVEDRQNAREKAFQTFLATWDSIAAENAWQALEILIEAPLSLEESVPQESPEEAFDPEIDQTEENPEKGEDNRESPSFDFLSNDQ